MFRMIRRLSVPWFVLAALLTLPAAAHPAHRALGDSRVVAVVPSTGFPGDLGFPEGVVSVNGKLAFVSTPATFGTTGSAPSKIFGFNLRTGEVVRTLVIQGQDTTREHALSGMAFDGNKRLYVIDTQQGILRLTIDDDDDSDADSETQELYAPPLPDLPAGPLGDRPPLANDIAFDHQGNLYITDSFQGAIWRVPPGGGDPQLWFHDPRLDVPFGPNGIRVSPDGTEVFIVVSIDFAGTGHIFRLPLVDDPRPSELRTFHCYPFGQAPDGLAFGRSGQLYVALASANAISVLEADGTESQRFEGPAKTETGSVPYDAPATIAFNKQTRSLLVTNHAVNTGIPEHFVLFDVFVDDPGLRLPRPDIPEN